MNVLTRLCSTISGLCSTISGLCSTISRLWNERGFELLIYFSIGFILIVALFRIGKRGSYTSNWKRIIEPIEQVEKMMSSPDRYRKGYVTNPNRSRGFPTESKGEKECRSVLEDMFGVPFPNRRPDFLSNPITNNNLEIDCYNDELKLGVEYDGATHFKFNSHAHKNYDSFLNGKYRDELKNRMCRENGVTLIRIPYTVKTEDIRKYLYNELLKTGYGKYIRD
jgi:hypothetical protein